MSNSIPKCKSLAVDSWPSKFQHIDSPASSSASYDMPIHAPFATSFGKRTVGMTKCGSTSTIASSSQDPSNLTKLRVNPESIENPKFQCITQMDELADIIDLAATAPREREELLNRIETIIHFQPKETSFSPWYLAMRRVATAIKTFMTQDELLTPIEEGSSPLHRKTSRISTSFSTRTQGEFTTPVQEPPLNVTVLSEQEKNMRVEDLEFFRNLADKDCS